MRHGLVAWQDPTIRKGFPFPDCDYVALVYQPEGGGPYEVGDVSTRLMIHGVNIVATVASSWRDVTHTEETGAAVARAALAAYSAAGMPLGRPIYFRTPSLVAPEEMSQVEAYFRGVRRVMPVGTVGVYASPEMLSHIRSEGLAWWTFQAINMFGELETVDPDIRTIKDYRWYQRTKTTRIESNNHDFGQWFFISMANDKQKGLKVAKEGEGPIVTPANDGQGDAVQLDGETHALVADIKAEIQSLLVEKGWIPPGGPAGRILDMLSHLAQEMAVLRYQMVELLQRLAPDDGAHPHTAQAAAERAATAPADPGVTGTLDPADWTPSGP